MPKLRVHNVSMSLDGFVAGPNQSETNPMGDGGMQLHEWALATRTARTTFGLEGGSTGLDDDYAAANNTGVGATIIGRNMFGPVRGPWPDESWRGWWGDEPPYHNDVFVLTHHPRPSLPMDGDTTFHFVHDPIDVVLAHAFAAAGGLDVQLGGGAATLRQFLAAGLIDEMHLAIVPVLLGSGEPLFVDSAADGYSVVESVTSPSVLHVRLSRSADS